MQVTNNSKALQGVHSVEGLVFIEAGATKEIEIAPDYLERAKSLPFLTIKGSDPLDHDGDEKKGAAHPPAGQGYDAMTVPQLKELAAAREIDLGDAKKRDDIVATLELADEAATQA